MNHKWGYKEILCMFMTCSLIAGCGASGLKLGGTPRTPPPEYAEKKVGLYVDDKIEKFYRYGSASTDASDSMAFHLQQTLPSRMFETFHEMFGKVDLGEPGANVKFKVPDLAGYFFVKVMSVRYDYPDPNLTVYRAEVEMLVEFKNFDQERIWSMAVRGEGAGYSDANAHISDFSRGASAALEDAYDKAIDELSDAVYKAPRLREYFRSRPNKF